MYRNGIFLLAVYRQGQLSESRLAEIGRKYIIILTAYRHRRSCALHDRIARKSIFPFPCCDESAWWSISGKTVSIGHLNCPVIHRRRHQPPAPAYHTGAVGRVHHPAVPHINFPRGHQNAVFFLCIHAGREAPAKRGMWRRYGSRLKKIHIATPPFVSHLLQRRRGAVSAGIHRLGILYQFST